MEELKKKNLTPDQVGGQEIMEHWRAIATEIPIEAQDEAGELYVEHACGLGREIAQEFVRSILGPANHRHLISSYSRCHQELGNVQSGSRKGGDAKELAQFWHKVQKLAPGLFTSPDQDVAFILEKDNGAAPFMLILELLSGQKYSGSLLLQDIRANAHAYK